MLSISQMSFLFTVLILIVSIQAKEYEYPTRKNSKGQDDYYSSLLGVQSLAKQEQRIVAELVHYKEKLSDTLTLINEYLDDYNSSMHSIMKRSKQLQEKYGNDEYPIFKTDIDLELLSYEATANPLTVFKLLRRFAIGLDDIQDDLNNDYHTKFAKYMDEVSTKFPSLDDLRGAADGLLRLQETYRMPTSEMGNGKILDKMTDCKLTAADMQFIGVRAVNVDLFATGLEWLYHAYQKVLNGDVSLPKEVIENHLMTGRKLHNEELTRFRIGPSNLFSNMVDATYTNIPDLFIPPVVTEYPLGVHHTRRVLHDNYNFDALCRGDQLLSPTDTKNLKCWYSHDMIPYNKISPLKFEMLHENPPVLQVYDLVSDKLINHIKNRSIKHLKRAKVVGIKSDILLSDVRTSSVAWIWDTDMNDKLLSKVPRLVNRATGLVTGDSSAAEDLQVQCYGSVGGYYIPHFDSLAHPDLVVTKERKLELMRGDRVATIMFYLSDVELGGGTAFPRMGIVAKAIKGSAVIWYNLKFNGERDPLTIHGGCPVLYGNKWGMIKHKTV